MATKKWRVAGVVATYVAALVVVSLLSSCSGLDQQRVAADRATHDWFAPMTRAYISADPRLDEAAKATHLRGLDAWDERIRADEAALGVIVPVSAPLSPPGGAR